MADEPEDPVELFLPLGHAPALHLEREGDVLRHSAVREQKEVLEHHADAAQVGRQPGHVGAADLHSPAIRAPPGRRRCAAAWSCPNRWAPAAQRTRGGRPRGSRRLRRGPRRSASRPPRCARLPGRSSRPDSRRPQRCRAPRALRPRSGKTRHHSKRGTGPWGPIPLHRVVVSLRLRPLPLPTRCAPISRARKARRTDRDRGSTRSRSGTGCRHSVRRAYRERRP